ncbi:MAG: hypothetical protein A2Y12_08985 [Planctomycetes bacterium GWF2_42_9]|nr:MAG: hypothetical protein A2Y12_08985 [Planctomycetes bacterium GWF2_42_9]
MRFFAMLIMNVSVAANTFGFYEASAWNIAARPRQVNEIAGNPGFVLRHSSTIYVADDNDMTIAGVLRDYIKEHFGFILTIVRGKPVGNVIGLKRDVINNTRQEQYKLDILPSEVGIAGHDRGAVRNGVALLMGILSDPRLCLESRLLIIPSVQITDWPKITGFRGMHLQIYSTPFEPDSIKRFVDGAMLLRMNTLVFDIGSNWKSTTNKANGSYTREQIRELVQYAKVRGFTVIPSMNLLGHSERGPIWYSKRGEGIDMTNSLNYSLVGSMLTEMVVDYDNPAYFHGGMDEALTTIQLNAAAMNKTERDTLKDHIIAINNICKARGMQLIIWHDMLVDSSEVSEVASGTPAPNGTAAARPLVPNDVIINVWDYNNGGGVTCVQLFKMLGNPVIGLAWMDVSVSDMSNTVVTQNLAGMITGTWTDICVYPNPLAQVFWQNEHFSRSLALGGHYSWYSRAEVGDSRTVGFDPAVFSNLCRWERGTRRIPRDCNFIDMSAITGLRNLDDDGPRIINAVNAAVPHKNGLSYFRGMPFKVDTSRYLEWQSKFSGSFAIADNQNSPAYKHRVTIKKGSTKLRTFDVDGVNIGRGQDQLVIYTNQNRRTNTSIWGSETVVSNGKVVLMQTYNSADSRIPRNGFVLSAHGSRMGDIATGVSLGDTVTVERVYSDHNEPAFVLDNRAIPATSSGKFITVNSKIQNLEILQSAVYSTMPGDAPVVGYMFTYSDNSQSGPYNMYFGRELGAFNESVGMYDPNVSKKIWLAYTNYGKDSFQGEVEEIYSFHWKNPVPEKTVKTITISRGANAPLIGVVVLGMTSYNDFCGEYNFAGDFDDDCLVGLKDLSVFTEQWLMSR